MSAGDIDHLFSLWDTGLVVHNDQALFRYHQHLYKTIDASCLAHMPWECFMVTYKLEEQAGLPMDGEVPSWKKGEHEIWFRDPQLLLENLIGNPDFVDEFDFVPYHEYYNGAHRFCNFMSGDWAWKEAVGVHFVIHMRCA
jgi:hypothetical protein